MFFVLADNYPPIQFKKQKIFLHFSHQGRKKTYNSVIRGNLIICANSCIGGKNSVQIVLNLCRLCAKNRKS